MEGSAFDGSRANRFRKRPVVVDAIQWTGENDREVAEFLGLPTDRRYREFSILTLEGQMVVSLWDWIIRGVEGEFYPCKPDVFALTHEPA